MQKKIVKKYTDLMFQAKQATGRKEAVWLIKQATQLKNNFDQYEMMKSDNDWHSTCTWEQLANFFMSLETTVFKFKIKVPFEQWAKVYDSEENLQMNKEL